MSTLPSISAVRNASKGRPAALVLAVVCVAQFMVILDVSIVNVALPNIREDLGMSQSGLAWVLNAYTLAFAGFLLLGGRAADLYGRRRLFLIGVALFGGASLLGGLAQNGSELIIARALQGFGGAVLSPATLNPDAVRTEAQANQALRGSPEQTARFRAATKRVRPSFVT